MVMLMIWDAIRPIMTPLLFFTSRSRVQKEVRYKEMYTQCGAVATQLIISIFYNRHPIARTHVRVRYGVFFSCDQAALRTLLSVCPSVCLSVWLSHFFHYVPVIVSSWNFEELLPLTKVMSMQEVKVRGQKSRSQRSWPRLAVSGL